jgi:hypothetical protein
MQVGDLIRPARFFEVGIALVFQYAGYSSVGSMSCGSGRRPPKSPAPSDRGACPFASPEGSRRRLLRREGRPRSSPQEHSGSAPTPPFHCERRTGVDMAPAGLKAPSIRP